MRYSSGRSCPNHGWCACPGSASPLCKLLIFRCTKQVVVGVANSIDLTDRTLPYLKQKRCEPKTVHFKAYDQEQLARIIVHMQRKVKTTQAAAITAGGGCGADSGGGGDGGGADGSWARTGDGDWRVGLSRVTLEQDAINFCARKVASVSGDARKLLALCSAAARIAVRDAAEASQEPQKEAAGSARGESESVPVEITHVVAAAKEIFGGNVIDILQRGLTTTQQLAVCAFVLLLRKGESGHVTLATLYAEFRQLCRRQQLEHMCVDKPEFISLCENALAAQRVLAMSDAPRGRARPSSSSARGRGKKIGGLRRGGGGGGLGGDGRKVTLQVKESDVMKALGQKGLYKRILVVDELRRPEQQ
jgi:Cdc6-like AAA superfamily ATPase